RYFFFFSSRRRHTRFSRDWSSDVCSSDLGLRVLCLDNDREILDGMRLLLARWQAVAILAATVDEALERMADSAPQAMLVDYHLQIGRASCRERVSSPGGEDTLHKRGGHWT